VAGDPFKIAVERSPRAIRERIGPPLHSVINVFLPIRRALASGGDDDRLAEAIKKIAGERIDEPLVDKNWRKFDSAPTSPPAVTPRRAGWHEGTITAAVEKLSSGGKFATIALAALLGVGLEADARGFGRVGGGFIGPAASRYQYVAQSYTDDPPEPSSDPGAWIEQQMRAAQEMIRAVEEQARELERQEQRDYRPHPAYAPPAAADPDESPVHQAP
jgi:hypothetical protein